VESFYKQSVLERCGPGWRGRLGCISHRTSDGH
jgi:hypothetical protein